MDLYIFWILYKSWEITFASNEILLKPKNHLRVKSNRFWVLEEFPHFRKTGRKSGETIFCNLKRLVKWIQVLQSNWKVPGSNSTWHSTRHSDPDLLCGSRIPSGKTLIAQARWLTFKWDFFLDNSQKLAISQPSSRLKKLQG